MKLLTHSHLPSLRWWPLMALACVSTAQAHHLPAGYEEVDEFATHGASRVFLHPFTGVDHILVAMGVGWMAWSMGRKTGTRMTAAFLGCLMLGLLGGQVAGAIAMEGALALTVAAVGYFLLPNVKTPNGWRVAAALAAGLLQGVSHAGVAMAGLSTPLWAVAMAAGTTVFCVAGYGTAHLASQRTPSLGRWAAAALVIVGATQWIMA